MNDSYDLDTSFSGGLVLRAGKRVTVRIRARAEGLCATLESQESQLIPWSDLRLQRGGSSGNVIFATDRRKHIAIDCEEKGFLRALEGASGNQLTDELARLEGQRISGRWAHRATWMGTLAVLLAMLWVVPIAFRAAVDAVVDSLPYSVDETMGEAAQTQMGLDGGVLEDELIQEAIEEIVDRLSPYSSLAGATFTVRVVESDVVNAFALPGGYLTVFTGLLESAEGPEQVAGVIAHEMAHATLRHGLSRAAHSVGVWVGLRFMLGDVDGVMAVATEVFSLATVNSYSREQEAAADSEGVRMLLAARIDPSGLAGFFEILEREHGSQAEPATWMRTHPEHLDRIHAIEQQIAERTLPEFEDFDFDWAEVQARLNP
ncbi:MAG: Zn-dependent protease with chaperone function [Planctomycetota bacterium]|jgi:Zn-dependent protease with chaperone function